MSHKVPELLVHEHRAPCILREDWLPASLKGGKIIKCFNTDLSFVQIVCTPKPKQKLFVLKQPHDRGLIGASLLTREVNNLQQVRGTNGYQQYVEHSPSYIVTKYHGDAIIDAAGTMSEECRIDIVRQIIDIVKTSLKSGRCQCDVKPDNLCVNNANKVTMIDLVEVYGGDDTVDHGTYGSSWYNPPQVGDPYKSSEIMKYQTFMTAISLMRGSQYVSGMNTTLAALVCNASSLEEHIELMTNVFNAHPDLKSTLREWGMIICRDPTFICKDKEIAKKRRQEDEAKGINEGKMPKLVES